MIVVLVYCRGENKPPIFDVRPSFVAVLFRFAFVPQRAVLQNDLVPIDFDIINFEVLFEFCLRADY
jgi:hypothetical protein